MGRKDEDTGSEVKRRRSSKGRSDSVTSQSDTTHEDTSHPPKRVKQEASKGDSDAPVVVSLYDLEEKEAHSRSSSVDLKLFRQTSHKIHSLIKNIHGVKSTGVDANSTEIDAKRVEAMLLTANLKKLNRLTQIRGKKAQERTEEMKQKADVLHLDLQNLLYEVAHLQKEIANCNGFMSRDEDIQLVPLEEFYEHAPETAAKKTSLESEPHKLMLARLEWELEQRKSLAMKRSDLVNKKDGLSRDIDAKQQLLGSLQPKLDTILQSTLPLQESLGLPLEAERAQNETSFYLPRPLYVLYSQARAFREASARKMAVSILGDCQAAKAVSGLADKAGSDDTDDSDGDANGDGSDKASNKRRKHRREKEKARLEEQKKSLLKKHPLSIKLMLSCKAHIKLEVLFSYIPALHIVTVTVEVKEQANKTPPLILSSSLLSCDTLLDELFPNDLGCNTPNEANHFQLERLRMDKFGSYIAAIGKPYFWAQWICGLHYFPNAEETQVRESQFALSHQHIEAVVKALRQRVQSRVELQKQLASLESLTIMESPASASLFPLKVYTTLTSWQSIPFDDFAILPFTSGIMGSQLARKFDSFYVSVLSRQDVSMTVAIVVHIDYPETAPVIAVKLQQGHTTIQTRASQEIENEINTYYNEFLAADKPELLLSNLLRRLRVCLDVFCEVTYESFGRNRLITRCARGRDRALPLHYVPGRNFYTHR